MKEIALFIIPLLMVFTNITVTILSLTSKRNFPFTIAMFLLLILANVAISIFFIKPGILVLPIELKKFLQLFSFLPLIIVLFKESLIKKVFAFLMIVIFSRVLRVSGIAIAELFIAHGENAYYLASMISTFMLYGIYIILVNKFGRNLLSELFAHGNTKEWILYVLSAVVSWIFLELLLHSLTSNIMLSLLVVFFVFWSSIILCFAIINTHAKAKFKYEAEFADSIISTGQKYHQSMEDMYRKLSILRHDYKYHLKTINNLFNSGKLEDAKRYLDDIQKEVPENKLRHYCSNAVFNALLSSYAERCEKLNIKFKTELGLPESISIPNYEISIILGNLLENAVEACEKLKHGGEIELDIKTQGSYLAIMAKNNFTGECTLTSSKKNGGFGLQSVRAIAMRYEGHTLTEFEGDVFKIYVMLRM